jgi:hypothetical protein
VVTKFKPLTPPPPSPQDLVAAVRRADPAVPPARVDTSVRNDVSTTLNLRMRMSSVEAIAQAAEAKGLTLKQVVTLALRDAGITIAAEDLEDRSTKRRGRR